MNKLKNIGITALAGTLVSLSAAQAGGVSVTGSWELSYTNLDDAKVTGNKLGVNKNLGFGASGDVSDGGGVTWATTLGISDAMGVSSASMSINMGGIATLAYDSGTGGYGANAVDNIVPTAWEEIDYGASTGISDLGAASGSKGSITFSVKAPTAGTGLSISYAPRIGEDHIADGGTGTGGSHYSGVDVVLDFVDYDAAHFGFRWGVSAETELHKNLCYKDNHANLADPNTVPTTKADYFSCKDGLKHNPYGGSMFTKLQLGPIHFGTQATFKNLGTTKTSAIMNKRSIVGGLAAVFGDTLSLSYGVAYDKYRYNNRNRGFSTATNFNIGLDPTHDTPDGQVDQHLGPEDHEYVTNKYRGFSAAINLGPVALKGTRNAVESEDKTGLFPNDEHHSEINLSIAF